jgi:hypothetical protein
MVVLAMAVMQFWVTNAAAEYRIQPGILIGEEYNDNVFLSPDNEVDDFITRVVPSVHFVYIAPVWEWDVAYALDFRYYAERSKTDDSTHSLRLTNHTSIIREFFFIDVTDDYKRVSLDTSRDFTAESLFLNQTDTNHLNVTPYLRYNLSSHTSATTGYRYRNLWYEEPQAIDRTEQSVYADLSNELSLRTVVNAGIRYLRTETDLISYNRTEVFAGPRHEYAEGSTVWVIIGVSRLIRTRKTAPLQALWDVGIVHQFVTYTVSFNTALAYIDDPGSFTDPARRRIQRREDRYVATLRKETERFALGATMGRWEYRNMLTQHLENTRNGIGGSLSYEITPTLRGTYALTIDRYDDNRMRTYSMLYNNTARLEYTFPADTLLALEYRFAHGYAPDPVNYYKNYDNNRVVVELRKRF